MSKIIEYVKEVKGEMKNVTWPTKHQAIYSTIAVLAVSIFVAYYLGLLDYLFSLALKWSFLRF